MKWTCPLHYGAGVLAALVTLLVSVPIGVLMVAMFFALELWDAIKGRDSWWDWQEFICAYYLTCAVMFIIGMFGASVCEVCS